MKFPKRLRVSIVTTGIVLVTAILVILLSSVLAKFLIERYDERFLGRQVTLDWAYANPFTGTVCLNNVQVLESKKDTVFFAANVIDADFAMLKLFSGTYEVSRLIIDQPVGIIIQRKKVINFDDLITRFTPDSTDVNRTPKHINILQVSIHHGTFYYREKVIPIHYVLKDLNMECSGKRWNADTLASGFSFLSQNGKGGMKGDFTINFKTHDYRFKTVINNFDLEIIRQYLWELINYGMFSAQLDANVTVNGNFRGKDDFSLAGRIALADFHLGKTIHDDYASFDKLVLGVNVLSPVKEKFSFDSIVLVHPFFKYEQYDSLNSIERLFGKNGSNISDITSQQGRFNLVVELGRYLKKLSVKFFQSQYSIRTLRVSNGDLRFNDYSLSQEFSTGATAITIRADSISKESRRIQFIANSRIRPYGNLALAVSTNPKDSMDYDMAYHLSGVPVTVFNPYLLAYTSFPMDRGRLELDGSWEVRKGKIKSANHLTALEPRVAKRFKNRDLKWLPLPLIMTIVRERGNVISFDIPITGDLRRPHFGLSGIFGNVLKNFFIKPITIPYGIREKDVENKIENALTLTWETGQRKLRPRQRDFITQMARFLERNLSASIEVYPSSYAALEKEQILFFEAKKKYFRKARNKEGEVFSESDSLEVEKMSIKDGAFRHAVKQGTSDTVMFTMQEKCTHYIGRGKVDGLYDKLERERVREVRSFFMDHGIESRLLIHADEGRIPYNGFSFYTIKYKGEVPGELRRAYQEMDEFNRDILRKDHFGGKGDEDSQKQK